MPNPYDGPEYRRLLERARRSLERTGGDLSGSVSLGHPGDAERKAIIGITGQYRHTRTNQIAVRLAECGEEPDGNRHRGLGGEAAAAKAACALPGLLFGWRSS